ILRAEGFSLALDKIFAIAKTVDTNTMSLQYLEALKALGASPATKFVFPTEITRLLQPFLDYADRSFTPPPKSPESGTGSYCAFVSSAGFEAGTRSKHALDQSRIEPLDP